MKILCIGRNYVAHAKELHNAVPTEPVVFMKPQSALLSNDKDFYIPDFSSDIHYECELVYRVCNTGKHIKEKFAHKYVDAVTVGIDFTARDVQQKQKEKGLPWEIAKAFDGSAVVGTWIPLENVENEIQFSLNKNNTTVQVGNSKDMLFSVGKIIAYVSQYFTLCTGDIIYTGTPEGVGNVVIGDLLEAKIADALLLRCAVK